MMHRGAVPPPGLDVRAPRHAAGTPGTSALRPCTVLLLVFMGVAGVGSIFEDRERSLAAVCEQPVLLEQRLFALAREIMTHLD